MRRPPSPNPTTIAAGDAVTPGTALIAAHRDHRHGSPATYPATAHNLLSATHGDLIAYCRRRRLPYALDPSNDDVGYRRNALRAALGELRRSFPGLDAAVARCAAIARDEASGDERGALRRRLREELVAATGQVRDMTYERLDAVARAFQKGRAGRHFVRPGLEVTIRGSS